MKPVFKKLKYNALKVYYFCFSARQICIHYGKCILFLDKPYFYIEIFMYSRDWDIYVLCLCTRIFSHECGYSTYTKKDSTKSFSFVKYKCNLYFLLFKKLLDNLWYLCFYLKITRYINVLLILITFIRNKVLCLQIYIFIFFL